MSEPLAPAPGVVPPYLDLIGKPFAVNGRGPDGYDCAGLVLELLSRLGYHMPDPARPESQEEMARELQAESVRSRWVPCEEGPGAIATIRLLGGHVSHVAMVLPGSRLIHAWLGTAVCVERLALWRNRITGFYRPNENFQ